MDGSRIKIEATLNVDWDKAYIKFFASYCAKGKRKFPRVSDSSLITPTMEQEVKEILMKKITITK